MTIKLTRKQYEELLELEDGIVLEILYKGIPAYITPSEFGNITYKGRTFEFNFFAPSEAKLKVEGEEKIENQVKRTDIIGARFDPQKMHLYDVKTTGKHPVHLIEGGDILTEDERVFDEVDDMGWYWLNEKEYSYFKSQCQRLTILHY